MVQLTDRTLYSQQPFKVYRRLPNPIQQQQPQPQPQHKIPSYSNGAAVKIFDQTNYINQQKQHSSVVIQHPNEHQVSLQTKRERQRRAMIDRMVSMFDEDGLSLLY